MLKHLRKKNHGSIELETKSIKKRTTSQTEAISLPNKQIKIAPRNDFAKPTPLILIPIDKEHLTNAQRSFGCQTKFNESQSTACQTYYDPIGLSFEQAHTTSTASTSVSDMANSQSQETQTLNASLADDEYFSMILADISTQTNEYESNTSDATSSTNTSDYRSCSIQTSEVSLNTTCTQTTINQSQLGLISNLELANLDSDIYFNNDLCSDNQANYDTTGCQTNDYYFQTGSSNTVSTSTASIQTQTISYFNNNNMSYLDATGSDSRYIDTITQTDWNLIDQNF